MNNEQLKKQISAIIEKQIKIATYCMDESLFPDSFQTEIKNCFEQIRQKVEKSIEGFEPDLNFEDVVEWLGDYSMSWEEEREILKKLSDDEIEGYYLSQIKKDDNEIVITCDSMVQREKIKEFLETEIFTDTLRYNHHVENL